MVARTSIRRRQILECSAHAEHRDPRHRPHPRRQARRRPLLAPATELGGIAIKAALERAAVEPDQVQHVVMGQVLQAGQGQIPSRQAQIEAGIPKEVSSETINKVCASGVRAAGILDAAIRAGDVEVAVGRRHGVDVQRALPAAEGALRPAHGRRQGARRDDPGRAPQPVQREADVRGGDRGRRRARDDPRRHGPLGAALARAHDRRDRRGPPARGDRPGDGLVAEGRHRGRGRRGAAARHLARAARQAARPERARRAPTPPATRRASTTARGALVLASEDWAEANGKEVLGTIIAQAAVADDFAYLARTPANAAKMALEKAGLQPGDIDLWEINEAFASVTLNSIRMLGIDEDRVNVNGGAVAIGHPIGGERRAHPRHARARAAASRRRLRLRGDLLRRRPGRRRHRQGVTRPRLLPPPPGGGALRRPDEPGAAFFDLDRTLMEGSSAFQFGARRLPGGARQPPGAGARRVGERAVPPARLDRRGHRRAARADRRAAARACACATSSGSRPTCSPACCRGCTRACSSSPIATRTRGGRSSSAPPPRRRWRS